MKTVEITRHRASGPSQSTIQIAADIFRKEGIRGINKGVNAVALRQLTNWGSRLGISRFTESTLLNLRPQNQQNTGYSSLFIKSIGFGAHFCKRDWGCVGLLESTN